MEKHFLGTEKVSKLIFKLAIPNITAQFVNLLYNIVDRVFIGHMPSTGSLALSGVGICFPIIIFVSAVASFSAVGGATRASISMGEKNTQKAQKIIDNCFTMQVILSVVLTALMLLFNRKLLMVFGGSDNIINYAVDYMNVYAIGTIFVQLTVGMNAFITCQGYAKKAMLTVIIGAVLNTILDPIFIYVFGLGVRGAALATVISQAVSCVWVILFLNSKQSMFKINFKPSIEKEILLPCISLGMASFVMQGSEGVLSICFNESLQRYGGDIAVGAMTILTSIMQCLVLPLSGLTQGSQPVTSYNFGAGNIDRVRDSFFVLLKTGLLYSTAVWICTMLFPKTLAGFFSSNAELIDNTAEYMLIYCAGLFVLGAQFACQFTMISIGNAKTSLFLAVLRKFILLIPLIYILPLLLPNKTRAVFLAEPIADIIAVSITVFVFFKKFQSIAKKST